MTKEPTHILVVMNRRPPLPSGKLAAIIEQPTTELVVSTAGDRRWCRATADAVIAENAWLGVPPGLWHEDEAGERWYRRQGTYLYVVQRAEFLGAELQTAIILSEIETLYILTEGEHARAQDRLSPPREGPAPPATGGTPDRPPAPAAPRRAGGARDEPDGGGA